MTSLTKPSPNRLALRRLPAFSPVASKLMTLLGREDVSFKEASDLIKSDGGISVELLRLANSPMTGLRFAPTSILQALSVLGVTRVTSLVATLSMGRLLKPVSKLPLMRRLWRNNLAVALIARQWGEKYDVDSEKGYMFGLMAGLGRLALLVLEPATYTRIIDRAQAEGAPLDVLEALSFGFDNREAGVWLVEEWHLPTELLEVFSPAAESDLARVIAAAAEEATRLGFGVLEGVDCDPQDEASFEVAARVNQIELQLSV